MYDLQTVILPNNIFLKDVTDDINGAISAGLRGILVKTGKYRDGDEKKILSTSQSVVPSFVEAVDKILEELKV